MNKEENPWDMSWYGAEFSNGGIVIKVAHNFENDDLFQSIFHSWASKSEILDAEHFTQYVNSLRTAGVIPYYVIPWDQFQDIMNAHNINLEGNWEDAE